MGITGEHAGQEVRRLDDLAKGRDGETTQVTLLRGIVKGISVIVKLLVGIRGNQVAIMKVTPGVELRRPRDRRPASDDNTTESIDVKK